MTVKRLREIAARAVMLAVEHLDGGTLGRGAAERVGVRNAPGLPLHDAVARAVAEHVTRWSDGAEHLRVVFLVRDLADRKVRRLLRRPPLPRADELMLSELPDIALGPPPRAPRAERVRPQIAKGLDWSTGPGKRAVGRMPTSRSPGLFRGIALEAAYQLWLTEWAGRRPALSRATWYEHAWRPGWRPGTPILPAAARPAPDARDRRATGAPRFDLYAEALRAGARYRSPVRIVRA